LQQKCENGISLQALSQSFSNKNKEFQKEKDRGSCASSNGAVSIEKEPQQYPKHAAFPSVFFSKIVKTRLETLRVWGGKERVKLQFFGPLCAMCQDDERRSKQKGPNSIKIKACVKRFGVSNALQRFFANTLPTII